MTTADQIYAEGLVVVERRPKRGERGARSVGWTLHYPDCFQARDSATWPAPADPYPNTFNCFYCRPGDPHRFWYTENPDGTVTYACKGCDVTVTGTGIKTANAKMNKTHDLILGAIEVAKLTADGSVVNVLTPRNAAGTQTQTLHLSTCSHVRRAVGCVLAPQELDPKVVARCFYCKPDGLPAPPVGAGGLNPDRHEKTRHKRADGAVRIKCSCGKDTDYRHNDNAARAAWRRQHQAKTRARSRRVA